MSEHSAAPRPDVTDMYAVHGVFRDTLGAAPELVGGIAPGDAARVALIANYYENILVLPRGAPRRRGEARLPAAARALRGRGRAGRPLPEQHEEALEAA